MGQFLDSISKPKTKKPFTKTSTDANNKKTSKGTSGYEVPGAKEASMRKRKKPSINTRNLNKREQIVGDHPVAKAVKGAYPGIDFTKAHKMRRKAGGGYWESEYVNPKVRKAFGTYENMQEGRGYHEQYRVRDDLRGAYRNPPRKKPKKKTTKMKPIPKSKPTRKVMGAK